MSYLPLGSSPRFQTMEFQESEVSSHCFDPDVLSSVKLTPNRWISIKDKSGQLVVIRWIDPSLMSALQKSQYADRKNCGWFDTSESNQKG